MLHNLPQLALFLAGCVMTLYYCQFVQYRIVFREEYIALCGMAYYLVLMLFTSLMYGLVSCAAGYLYWRLG